MTSGSKDRESLRELAKHYLEICHRPEQSQRRRLWRRHNSLKGDRPLVYVRAFAWREMPQSECVCQDPLLRRYEDFFRHRLFWDTLGDDSVFEPWINLPASYTCQGWGVSAQRRYAHTSREGAFKADYPIREPADMQQLRMPWHEIDEARTSAELGRLHDAVGDLITVNVDRAPAYRMWAGDLSTDLGYLRGIENIMVDMVENPDWMHRLVDFMAQGVLRTHEQAEQAGHWGLSAHQNQAMPYTEELADPAPNSDGVQRRELWGYMAAQEFTAVSPAMHNEFLLHYQLRILRHFGLVAYGCCEDLTRKIGMLRQIPNLRRIAVSPFADVRRCAEQIGRDYVLSYRPSPTDMVSYGLNHDRVRHILRRDLEACRQCQVDITLKDVETVQHDPQRVRQWVALARGVIDELW